MANNSVNIHRRAFLKTGTSGGLMVALLPLSKITAGFPGVDTPGDQYQSNQKRSHRELSMILRKYGGEFGEAGKEY